MVPDAASIADLARVVAQVRPGHPVTTAALTLELQRGAVGKPSDGLRSLMERLADPAFRARLFTEAPLLRQLTYRCDGTAIGEKAFRRRRWTPWWISAIFCGRFAGAQRERRRGSLRYSPRWRGCGTRGSTS